MTMMLRPLPRVVFPYRNAGDIYDGVLPEDRCAERIRISAPATLRRSCDKAFAVELIDISVAGFACKANSGMHTGTKCWVTLPGLGPLQAEVVRNDGFTLGCAFATLINGAVMNMIAARYRVPETN